MEFIHIRVPIETRQRLKIVAATLGKSMTCLLGELIDKYLAGVKLGND